ncbi:heavy metal translocating P-type ATPase [Effusibacillus consociatus]|uniref:Cd(2+)-exporting ATPase n=1 Tax=Effusibacillus consociatus TaxID=1117041 RepID=A0ABV9Q7L2_9BACL
MKHSHAHSHGHDCCLHEEEQHSPVSGECCSHGAHKHNVTLESHCRDGCCEPHKEGVLVQLPVLSDEKQGITEPLSPNEAHSVFIIEGMDCGECARTVERVVGKLEGIRKIQVNFNTTKMSAVHTVDVPIIIKTIEQIGYRASLAETTLGGNGLNQPVKTSEFALYGMDCADCAANVEKRLSKVEGVVTATVNFGASKLRVIHTCSVERIIKAVDEAGYRAELQGQAKAQENVSYWEKHKRTILTAISGIALGMGFLFEYGGFAESIAVSCYMFSMILGGYYAARSGWYALKSRTLDMNFLMTVAAIGAAAIGQWSEGATVVFLFSVGNWLQAMTMERTRRSIRSLMDLAPKEALVKRDGREIKLPLSEVNIGDIVIVRPGERLPMDGIVLRGSSTVNQAPITGESIPVLKQEGEEVFAGTINETGALEFRVTKRVEDTTLSRIIHLVEEAQAQKAPSQQFVDKFAQYYTPAVVLLAALIAVVPPFFTGDPFRDWVYRALALLVIACPCALVISTPVSIVAAIGNAAKQGVLIKGGAFLEQMGAIQAIAFDKTGTLTEGKPKVVNVDVFENISNVSLLEIAAAIESRSEHPLAKAIMDEYLKLVLPSVEGFVALTGKGAEGTVNGVLYRIGKPAWFDELGYQWRDQLQSVTDQQEQGNTVILLGNESKVLGLIAISDVLRETSAETIRRLKEAGIVHTVMLTGDNERTAKAIQKQVGVDEYQGELLPEHKLQRIQELKRRFQRVAMVGDGINDAPALASADIGIAMGGAGTDTALETADIVLMSDDLSKLSFTVRLSRRALAIIKQNIWFSLLVKAVFLVLTVMGLSNLWMAVFADTGAALIVITNGMRLMNTR